MSGRAPNVSGSNEDHLQALRHAGRVSAGGAFENAIAIEVPEDTSPNAIIDRYQVPRHLAHLVLINGVYCAREERDRARLEEGDTLAVWPPVAGG